MTLAEAEDIYYRALCVWREMRGQSNEARLGCYWVITNRANDSRNRWPKTLYGVVTQKYQFSSFNVDDPNSKLIPVRCGALDLAAWQEIRVLVDAPGPDPTNGANAYESLPETAAKPGWALTADLVATIGGTRFYKL